MYVCTLWSSANNLIVVITMNRQKQHLLWWRLTGARDIDFFFCSKNTNEIIVWEWTERIQVSWFALVTLIWWDTANIVQRYDVMSCGSQTFHTNFCHIWPWNLTPISNPDNKGQLVIRIKLDTDQWCQIYSGACANNLLSAQVKKTKKANN